MTRDVRSMKKILRRNTWGDDYMNNKNTSSAHHQKINMAAGCVSIIKQVAVTLSTSSRVFPSWEVVAYAYTYTYTYQHPSYQAQLILQSLQWVLAGFPLSEEQRHPACPVCPSCPAVSLPAGFPSRSSNSNEEPLRTTDGPSRRCPHSESTESEILIRWTNRWE